MDIFNVSRSTIIKDLREMRRILYRNNLVLEYRVDKGYEIQGDELQKRSLLLIIISEYQYLIKLKSMVFYNESDIEKFMKLFVIIEEKLGVMYVRNTLKDLITLLAIVKYSDLPKIKLKDSEVLMLSKTNEYEIGTEVFKGCIQEKEYLYLTIHLLGLRIQFSENIQLSNEDDYISEIVHFVINEFYNLTLINFKNHDELYNNLYVHLKQALFRYKYGIIYYNELRNQIITEFPQVYRITKIICSKLEKIINHTIGEDEIAFIAIHFGGLMEREQQIIAHPKVMLVCLSGMALYKNLRREIESFTKDIEVIGALRMCDVENLKDKVDYIISAVPLKNIVTKAKILIVNPILNDRERYRIIDFLDLVNVLSYDIHLLDNILADIKDYILEDKVDKVREIISIHVSNK